MLELNSARLARLKGWSKLNAPQRKRVRAYLEQYLGTRGWARSIVQDASVDLEGPVPWYTYPSIRDLERVIPMDAAVFEYGSGNSTLWWQSHAKQVVSVEHDQLWFEHSNASEHSDVRLRESGDQHNAEYFEELALLLKDISPQLTHLDEPTRTRRGLTTEPFLSYVAELMTFPREHFDVIIVDGMAREACARVAADRLNPNGFIVFDNSDREEYANAYKHLLEQGFARINYWGPGPINPYEWCTSIFTKSLDLIRR